MIKNMNKPSDEEILRGKIDMNLVTKLIYSNVSPYKIEAATGIPNNNIYKLRHGERNIINLNVKTVYSLSEYAKKIGIK